MTYRVVESHRRNMGCNIHVIMKTMCLSGYHHNRFVATHELWSVMHG